MLIFNWQSNNCLEAWASCIHRVMIDVSRSTADCVILWFVHTFQKLFHQHLNRLGQWLASCYIVVIVLFFLAAQNLMVINCSISELDLDTDCP